LFNYTTDEISNISFTRTPLNVGSAGTVYQLAFNNTSSGVITTSSLAFVPATTPPTVVDLQLNGASTVAINTTTIGATGFSSIAWDPTGAYLAVGTQQLNVYNRVGDTTYNAISTGSYYSPSTGYIPNMTWNTTTNVLNFLGSYAPYIFEYGINTTTNTLTPLDSWGRVSAGFSLTSTSTAFIGSLFSNQNPNFSKLSPDGSLLVNGSATSPYFQASYYDYLNTNQVTPLTISSATTLTSSGVQNAFWSPNGRILTLLGTSSPYINNYYISGTGTSTVFTRLPQPVDPWGINPLTNSGYDGPYAAWSPDSSILVVSGSNTTPYVMFYSVTYTGTSATITRGTSTHFSSIPTGVTYSPSFSPDGKILAIGGGGTTALTYNVTFNGTQTNFLKFISTLTQASTPLVDLKWSNDNNWLGTIYGNSSQRAAYIYRRTTVGTATNFTLTSPAITDPVASDVFWRGQFSNDSSKFYLFEEAALSASINSTVSALNYSSQSNTWTYTTTSVTIDMPLPSGNIDWRVDI
jgi:hypothetical protein